MALTAIERKVLRAAQLRIVQQRNVYVCTALRDAASDMACSGSPEYMASQRLRAYIMTQLGSDCGSLEDWCFMNRLIATSQNPEAMRASRIEWINWMLGDDNV